MAEQANTGANPEKGTTVQKKRRSIPGDFSYTATYGKFKSALERMTTAERPEIFNKDYIASYLEVSGGSAAPIPPILKRLGFLSSESRPTELYAKFQNEQQRPAAALEGLRKGFAELFKKNTYAHTLEEDEIKGLLVEITGLQKTDAILGQIYGTFDAVRQFIPKGFMPSDSLEEEEPAENEQGHTGPHGTLTSGSGIGLAYHINIVLPETKDIAVFNAIFQSLKKNLLD